MAGSPAIAACGKSGSAALTSMCRLSRQRRRHVAARDEAADARTIVTARVIDAPRELVFEAWTDPQHLAQWWGPDGFSTTTSQFDFGPGDGHDYENRITFGEIMRPERLT